MTTTIVTSMASDAPLEPFAPTASREPRTAIKVSAVSPGLSRFLTER